MIVTPTPCPRTLTRNCDMDIATNNTGIILTVVVPALFIIGLAIARVIVKHTPTTLDDEILDEVEHELEGRGVKSPLDFFRKKS